MEDAGASPGEAEQCPGGPGESPSPAGEKRRAGAAERLGSLALALAFAAVAVVAFHLEPDPAGIGTHTRIGLPPCGLYDRLGIPCLSCGWTTAFAHMARLQVVRAVEASPFGALLFLAGFAAALGNLAAAASGRSFFWFLSRLDWTWPGIAVVVLVLGSWIYKILAVTRFFD